MVSRAVIVAFGVAADGTFLRSLKRRGLSRVQWSISDAHEGLKAAVQRVLAGSSWQRCRVHFNRNILTRVGKAHGEIVTATIRATLGGQWPSGSRPARSAPYQLGAGGRRHRQGDHAL